jgi:L-glyceraldehyde 3-phosphate reductase
MWEGPYGNFGSRKYLISSLDQSLKRMGIDYVDIFYHHRPDPETPLEETMMALDQVVKQGKALYAGISNYDAETTVRVAEILRELKTPFLIHQERYSLFDRHVEKGLTDILDEAGIGLIAFSPLAQGILSDKYLDGVPEGSRASKSSTYLTGKMVAPYMLAAGELNRVAKERRQSLSQMALSWLINKKEVTSVLVGVSSVDQLNNNIGALENIKFTRAELAEIDKILLTLSPDKSRND